MHQHNWNTRFHRSALCGIHYSIIAIPKERKIYHRKPMALAVPEKTGLGRLASGKQLSDMAKVLISIFIESCSQIAVGLHKLLIFRM